MTLRACGRSLLHSVEFTGIHTDPSPRCGGNRILNSTSALMTGRLRQAGFRAAGAAALIPSSTREGSGSSIRSFRAVHQRPAARAQRILKAWVFRVLRGCTLHECWKNLIVLGAWAGRGLQFSCRPRARCPKQPGHKERAASFRCVSRLRSQKDLSDST